ncbi:MULTISPECIES: phosphoribosyltransferase family protein [Halomonadaceae]|uniref:phosphoribosyltransferase family protein n=1 Tax=Halomonadaceae TaxID=28256 RepID=UPI00159A0505|nr:MULTISPECIES: phosphoribosyltransferase family protein [Halomonas]QJQ95135.1 phosphoribosyltransferase [Halomonas sp. PA5]
MINYKSFYNLSEDIKKHLYKIHSGGYDLIVGIPRSGMIPAYMIGLYTNLNVIDIDGYIQNRPLKNGLTRQVKNKLCTAHDARKVLLVDDSILSGESMAYILEKLPNDLRERVTSVAIYSDRKNRADIDFYFEHVPAPRIFEWNVFHHRILSRACVDIDGVLCLDPSEDENDDGKKYLGFLTNAKPHIIPSCRIHSLVTSRLEKYRPQTEEWLKKNGIQYENLIMLDLPSKAERQRLSAHSAHKAAYFKDQSELVLFIDSNVRQAKKIMELTAKPVYCVDNNHMFLPSFLGLVKNKRKKVLFRKFKIRFIEPLSHLVFRALVFVNNRTIK